MIKTFEFKRKTTPIMVKGNSFDTDYIGVLKRWADPAKYRSYTKGKQDKLICIATLTFNDHDADVEKDLTKYCKDANLTCKNI